jgi:hypothetical protein
LGDFLEAELPEEFRAALLGLKCPLHSVHSVDDSNPELVEEAELFKTLAHFVCAWIFLVGGSEKRKKEKQKTKKKTLKKKLEKKPKEKTKNKKTKNASSSFHPPLPLPLTFPSCCCSR